MFWGRSNKQVHGGQLLRLTLQDFWVYEYV